jgi:proteasome accessory factor A
MSDPAIHFGLETEIGITRDGADDLDVVAESVALVRSATAPGVALRWDYACEDPHLDMRGFRVSELRQDADEADYYSQDTRRTLSYQELKSDLALGNGARFYNDHAHPEYCTPECSTLEELVAHDRAGERLLMSCAQHLSAEQGAAVRLYKNNTDLRGHSYGCHENYLLPRALAWDHLVAGVQAFLVTRQVFAGAGKFAIEAEDERISPAFQISQRSDFFSELQSVDTMQRRPIINTRDEPHANPRLWRRFHVILGDANLCPFATWLKVGATALVLEAIVRQPTRPWPRLSDPLGTLRGISRDPAFRWEIKRKRGGPTTALALQREYIQAVRAECDLAAPGRLAVVEAWEEVIDDLEADYSRCRDRVDWVAKLALLREFQKRQGLADDDPWLQSLDLEYHRLDLAQGLYYGLEQTGAMRGVPPEAAVRQALTEPPPTTRAAVRGYCIQKFPQAVLSAQWDHVTFQGRGGPIKVNLMDLFDPAHIRRLCLAIQAAKSPEDLRSLA